MKIIKMMTTALLALMLSLPFAGCMPSMGKPFPVNQVRQIEIGKTTRTDIRQMFGAPWRTGIEDGYKTWTYGEYTFKLTRDLVIRFDEQDVVKSYSFSSSFPEDASL